MGTRRYYYYGLINCVVVCTAGRWRYELTKPVNRIGAAFRVFGMNESTSLDATACLAAFHHR